MKFFYIALFFLPLLLTGDQRNPQGKQMYAMQFENTARSPRARIIMLMNSISNQVNQLLPSKYLKRKPRSISASYERIKDRRLVRLQLTRKGNYRIILPDNIHDLQLNPETLIYLVCWHIQARMDMNLDTLPLLRNSWFVTGLVRRLQREIHPHQKAPFSSHYPAAYTLTSIGRYPRLSSLITVSMTPEDTTLRLLYEEYSDLLLQLCSRNGMFKNGMLANILDDTQGKLKEELICKRCFSFLDNRLKADAKKKNEIVPDLENWFQTEINTILSRNFLPVSEEAMEMQYERALHFRAPLKKSDKKNENEEIQMLAGDLEVLLNSYDKLESPEEAASQMASNLLPVFRIASPDLLTAINRMHTALIQFGKLPGKETTASLRQANRNFYLSLEKKLLLEKFLEETEMQCVSPAARYRLTLALLEYRKQPQIPYLQKLSDFLNKTEGFSQKQ